MSLRRVNLNLLPILQMLLNTQSVSVTASTLGLSQPTVSDALSKLRDVFDDQLLVRIGARMKLTPRAAQLIEPLEVVCAGVGRLLRPEMFDPRQATREMVIATSDICGYLLVRSILDLLRDQAPGISLHLIDVDHSLTAKMAAREIDFALLPEFAVGDLAPAPLRFIPLIAVQSVVLMRRGHPLSAKEVPTPSDLVLYPHIMFQPDAVITELSRVGPIASGNIPNGQSFEVVARVGQMLLVPHLVADSESIAIVPKQLADAMSPVYALESRPLPFPEPQRDMGLAWSPVYDSDPAHEWFRNAMKARCSSVSFKPNLLLHRSANH